jgi:hypothetical protein
MIVQETSDAQLQRGRILAIYPTPRARRACAEYPWQAVPFTDESGTETFQDSALCAQ